MAYRRIGTVGDHTGSKKLYYTPGTDQQYVFKEVLVDECYDKLDWNKDDVVLDIGGHIGSFCVYLFDKVNTIVSLEPFPEAFKMHQDNMELNGINNVWNANIAVGPRSGETTLFVGAGMGHNTTHDTNENKPTLQVGCRGIADIFDQWNFTKIKCDCEGAEIDIFRDLHIPETVKQMIFETHEFMVGKEATAEMVDNFKSQGFTTDFIDNDYPLHRTHLLVCKR